MNGGVQVEDVGDDAVRQESVWEGGSGGGVGRKCCSVVTQVCSRRQW